ncbi:MAG: DUF63 family protein [Methanomassiliicoccales archaeon]|nr:DUF63 family protein [Methanomassiliicoccales archaeon]
MRTRFFANLARKGARRSYWFWGGIAALPFIALSALALLFPKQVWEDFLYRYFWGPVISDAQEHPVSGITEGYNIVSTLIYGLLLAVAIMVMYKAVKRLRLRVDARFIGACLLIFIVGGVARALEDAQLFRGGVQYFFISPLIYVQVAGIFIFTIATALIIERKEKRFGQRTHFLTFAILVVGLLATYFLITGLDSSDLSSSLPWMVPLGSGIVCLALWHLMIRKDFGPVASSLVCVGLLCLLIASAFVVQFQFDASWRADFQVRTGRSIDPHAMEFVVILTLATVCTLGVALLGKWLKGRPWAVVAQPINLAMFFAHFLDGSATFRGVDIYGYSEKHVLPTFLIDLAGTAAVVLLFKLLLVLVLIWVLDFLFAKDLERYPNLSNIIKFGVIFLGLAPGVRDILRISIGV